MVGRSRGPIREGCAAGGGARGARVAVLERVEEGLELLHVDAAAVICVEHGERDLHILRDSHGPTLSAAAEHFS